MSANSLLPGTLLVALLAAMPAGAAVPAAPAEAQRFEGGATFQEIIETRCTLCHTRERVDAAIRNQADLETLLRRMIERGAIISERDHKVLGTFWGSPLKGGEQPAPAAR